MIDIDYKPHMIVHYLTYCSAVWFLFILIFCESKYKPTSLVLAVFWCLYSYSMLYGVVSGYSRQNQFGILISTYSLTALILTFNYFAGRDATAIKHALTMCFAVSCNVVISYSLTRIAIDGTGFINSYPFIIAVYKWYFELIIMFMILQMAISHDGFTGSLCNVQKLLRRDYSNSYGSCEDLFTQEKREREA